MLKRLYQCNHLDHHNGHHSSKKYRKGYTSVTISGTKVLLFLHTCKYFSQKGGIFSPLNGIFGKKHGFFVQKGGIFSPLNGILGYELRFLVQKGYTSVTISGQKQPYQNKKTAILVVSVPPNPVVTHHKQTKYPAGTLYTKRIGIKTKKDCHRDNPIFT
ncbi:MAG: hypothetical protein IJ581_07800 [Paludibacteraceae bacterium]|nr:hypothetical protein [Paludibacteraceae bacterium]